MDFFNWAGSQVSSAVDWLFKGDNFLNSASTAANLYSASTQSKGKDTSSGILGAQISKALNARAAEPKNAFSSTRVARPTPADVHSTDKPLYKDSQTGDAWMSSLRSMLNVSKSMDSTS